MRPPSWLNLKKLAPPQVRARSVYDLAGTQAGRAVLVVAPGPSFASFPRDELERHPTIGVNSALELCPLDYWLFAEPVLAKDYRALYSSGRAKNVVSTRYQAHAVLERVLPESVGLFWFRYGHASKFDPEDDDLSVIRMARTGWLESGRRPWWARPDKVFLPGRCSVATHAVSLAVLMGAAVVVTVGVDLKYDVGTGAYYAPGVTINQGPGRKPRLNKKLTDAERVRQVNTARVKALGCTLAWTKVVAALGIWRDAEILTISPSGSGLPGSRRVTVDDAIDILRDHNA